MSKVKALLPDHKLMRLSLVLLGLLVGCQSSSILDDEVDGIGKQFHIVGAVCIEQDFPVKRSRLKLSLSYQSPNRLYGQISTPWISRAVFTFGQHDRVAWIVDQRGKTFTNKALEPLLEKQFSTFTFPPLSKLARWLVGEVSLEDQSPVYDGKGRLQELQYMQGERLWKVRFLKYRKSGSQHLPRQLQLIYYDVNKNPVLTLTIEIHLWTTEAIIPQPPQLVQVKVDA